MTMPTCGRRGLVVEHLEAKRLLAGDVTVATIDGNLFIDGDAAGNQIEVRSLDAPGRFVIQGLSSSAGDTTTINGNAQPLLVDGIDGRVLAGLGDGDDLIRVNNARFQGGVYINTGAGDDGAVIGSMTDPNSGPSVVAGSAFVIHTGPGNDNVSEMSLVVDGTHIIHTGAGSDQVRVGIPAATTTDGPSVVVHGTLAVGLGIGDDALVAHRLAARNAVFNGSHGDDAIEINRSAVARHLVANGGGGDDMVGVRGTHAAQGFLRGGVGDDGVATVDSVFAKLRVSLGFGADTLTAVGTTAHEVATFSGGQGMDRLRGGMNNFNAVRVVGFEGISLEDSDDDEAEEVVV